MMPAGFAIDKFAQLSLMDLGFFITYMHLANIKKSCRAIFVLMFFCSASTSCFLFAVAETGNESLYSLLHTIAMICYTTAYVWINEDDLWKTFAAISISDLFGGVPQHVMAAAVEGNDWKLHVSFAPGIPYIPYGFIMGGMLYLVLFLAFRKYLIQFSKEPMGKKLWVRIFGAVYMINALLRITSMHREMVFTHKQSWEMGIEWGIFLLSLTVALVFCDSKRTERQKQYYLRLQNQVLKWHYETLKEQIAVTRKFRQDVSGMLSKGGGVHSDVQKEKLQELISVQSERAVGAAVVGGEIVDQVLVNKKNQCEEEGIVFQIEAGKIVLLGYEEMDVVILLYNILDNAIESCRKIPAGEQRRIYLSIEQKEKNLIICCRNDRWGERTLREGKRTWKKDKNLHGTGMEIIRTVVEKYQGQWTFEEKETEFIARAELPEKLKDI